MLQPYAVRKQKGDIAEQMLATYFQNRPHFRFTHTAAEKLYPRSVTDQLMFLGKKYPLLNYLRFVPDFRVWSPESFWIDAKNGFHINQQSFSHYQRLISDGTPVYLAIYREFTPEQLIFIDVSEIVFHQSDWITTTGNPFRTINLEETPFTTVTP